MISGSLTMSGGKLVSIVIPAYNEADHLRQSLETIAHHAARAGVPYELVIVDDGSSDATWDVIKEASADTKQIRGVRLSRNFGKERAVCAGLESASGDAVIVMDADLQHPPELIPKMVKIWQQGNADIVESVKSRRGRESAAYSASAGLFYWIMEKTTGFHLQNHSDYKLLDRRVLEEWTRLGEFHVFFRGLVAWMGFRTKRIQFKVASRAAGESKWKFNQLTGFASNAVVSFSSLPLRLVWVLAASFMALAVVLTTRAIYLWAIGEAVAGFTTVIILQLLIASILLLSLGIIGEYIGKIFDEVKHRPRYLVMERTDNINSENRDAEPL